MGIDVHAQLTLGDIAESVQGVSRKLDKLHREVDLEHVRIFNPASSLVANGATPVLADLGGPNESYVWVVRRVSMGPVPGGAIPTLGTSLFICKGSTVAVGNQTVCDVAPVLPTAATYGFGEFVIRSPQHLVVYWVGGTNQIVIDCDVAEFARSSKALTF